MTYRILDTILIRPFSTSFDLAHSGFLGISTVWTVLIDEFFGLLYIPRSHSCYSMRDVGGFSIRRGQD